VGTAAAKAATAAVAHGSALANSHFADTVFASVALKAAHMAVVAFLQWLPLLLPPALRAALVLLTRLVGLCFFTVVSLMALLDHAPRGAWRQRRVHWRQAPPPPRELVELPNGMGDPFDMLGLERGATCAAVDSAARHALLTCHPDKLRGKRLAPGAAAAAAARFAKVKAAQKLIGDATNRAAYDAAIAAAAARAKVAAGAEEAASGFEGAWARWLHLPRAVRVLAAGINIGIFILLPLWLAWAHVAQLPSRLGAALNPLGPAEAAPLRELADSLGLLPLLRWARDFVAIPTPTLFNHDAAAAAALARSAAAAAWHAADAAALRALGPDAPRLHTLLLAVATLALLCTRGIHLLPRACTVVRTP
jgi:hypothetical protein